MAKEINPNQAVSDEESSNNRGNEIVDFNSLDGIQSQAEAKSKQERKESAAKDLEKDPPEKKEDDDKIERLQFTFGGQF